MSGPSGPSGPEALGAGGEPGREAPPEIIYLDVDDEITSAAARLRRSESGRVAFVLPYGSRLATSRINFRLLAREAGARAKRLDIVAADASARALAGSAGLPVHASVAALEAGDSGLPAADGGVASAGDASNAQPPPTDGTETRVIAVPRVPDPIPTVGRRRTPARTRNAAIAALVVLALVVAGGVGAFLYLPSATIVLTPTSETIGPLQLVVQARTDVTTPDPATLTVPAHSFSFEAAAPPETFTTTGVKVTEAAATGDVTFQNCDPSSGGGVFIPTGSRVSTDSGIGFRTLANLTIKRPPLFSCRTGSVAVKAEQPGTAGNVGAGDINHIPPGYDTLVLFVTNPQPTTGGIHSESPQVSQQDVDAALATLNPLLANDLDIKVREQAGTPAGTILFPETEVLGTAMPSVDPASLVGQAVATFQLGLSATGTVLGVDPTPVTALAQDRLTAEVGDGWQLVQGSTHIDIGSPTVSGDVVSFPVDATATRTRLVDHDALIAQVRGLVLAQARARLDDYGAVEITLWPDWVSTVPTDQSRISLTIEPAAPTGSAAPSSGASSP